MEKIEYDIDEFMDYCTVKNLSVKTIASYEQTLRLLAHYLIEFHNVKSAENTKELHIMSYIKYLKDRGKYTVVSNQNTKNINFPENREDFGKKIETTTINNYIRNIKVFDLSKFHEYRDYIITQLMFDTGMRLGETLLIKETDIDFTKRTILLPAENTKGKKDRYAFFSEEMLKQLRRWLKYKDRYRQSEYVFCTNKGKSLNISNYENNFKKYGNRIGLSEIHPHMLRNNFAKRFLMRGGDIYTLSKILGHSSVKVTEEAYLDLDTDDLRTNYQRYSPLAN